jgi:H+/gluconate symporter-like permease
MDLLAAFLLAILLVGIMTVKMGLSPFLSLVVASLVYGLLSGMGPELIGHVATGLGRIFSALAVIVFSGSVIAEHLRRSGGADRVV